MRLAERQCALDQALQGAHSLWHPQPFREIRPDWCAEYPALTNELLALADADVEALNNEGDAARIFMARHLPELSALEDLADLPICLATPRGDHGSRWAWEIPGRKQQQIEAFAAAASPAAVPVLDWCGGKGHLGRLLALQWQLGVTSLEIDALLCQAGEQLAGRARVAQKFLCRDALTATDVFLPNQHAVALHACGNLHRTLIRGGAEAAVTRFDIAPCCYHRGVADFYQPLSNGLKTLLTRDDTRLAVTETVTASPRLTRQRDKEMAWKLGFDSLRRTLTGDTNYRTFKSVPAAWFRDGFSGFATQMALREGLAIRSNTLLTEFEQAGWQRQREVMRLSIVRHAFRRALEVWLVLDLAVYLEGQSYDVQLGSFCPRQLTPRNLLISARRA